MTTSTKTAKTAKANKGNDFLVAVCYNLADAQAEMGTSPELIQDGETMEVFNRKCRWTSNGTLTLKGTKISFSEDYNRDMSDKTCQTISRIVRKWDYKGGATQVTFSSDGCYYVILKRQAIC